MTNSKAPTSREVAFVEWHDAEVAAIEVRMFTPDEPSVVRFNHLPVYHELQPDQYEIWSYRARLEVFSARRVLIEGEYGEGDYVSSAALFSDDKPFDQREVACNVRLPISRIELQFGSGRRVKIECGSVQFSLEEALEHVDNWSGPLKSSS